MNTSHTNSSINITFNGNDIKESEKQEQRKESEVKALSQNMFKRNKSLDHKRK